LYISFLDSSFLFIARLMTISAPMATINMRARTTDYTDMARVAQKMVIA